MNLHFHTIDQSEVGDVNIENGEAGDVNIDTENGDVNIENGEAGDVNIETEIRWFCYELWDCKKKKSP